MKKELHTFKDMLHEEDTAEQTYGCRQNNPDICNSNCLPGVCAFVRTDKICKQPPRSWKRLCSKSYHRGQSSGS